MATFFTKGGFKEEAVLTPTFEFLKFPKVEEKEKLEIPLGGKKGKGLVTIIDKEDYKRLKKISSGKIFIINGYAAIKYRNISYRLHRFIINTPDNMITDHINRNKLDNRKSNLRVCDKYQNQQHKKNKKVRSGYKGVYIRKKGGKIYYLAVIVAYGKSHYLGSFNTPLKAAKAYNRGAKKYHKEFALLNKI